MSSIGTSEGTGSASGPRNPAGPLLPSEYTVAEVNRALDVGHTVDQTTYRVVGGAEVADFRVQTQLRLAKAPTTPHPDWIVHTPAPVRATPAAYGASFSVPTTTDLLAFASDTEEGGTGGVTTGDVSNGCTAATCVTSTMFVLSNLYATSPHLAAWAPKAISTDHFELSSLLFSFNPANIQVYGLAGTTKSLLFCVDLPAAPDGGAGYTNTTASAGTACSGWAANGSGSTIGAKPVTWSSPYPAYDSAGNITGLYYGDDGGKLQCVNLISSPAVCAGGAYGSIGTAGAQIAATTAKLGPPSVIRLSNTPVENVIFIGDDAGNFYQIDDNAGTLTTRSYSLGTGAAYAIHGAPILDYTNQNAYVATGGKIYQFPLSTSAAWAPTASVTLFSSPTEPIDGSPSVDSTATGGGNYLYLATNNTLYKTPYPLTSTSYSEELLNAVSAAYTVDTQSIDPASQPLGYPLAWQGSVYVGTGTGTGSGTIEEYSGCSTTASKPILTATSNAATYGHLVQSGMVLDNAAADLYFGYDNGATSGGVVSYPLPSKSASAWSCPSGTTSTAGAACGTAGCTPTSGCLSDADCASTPSTPACNTTTHACVVCTATDEGACAGTSTPACNTAVSPAACIQCTASDSSACTGATPFCQLANADSHQNTCVGCLASANCSPVGSGSVGECELRTGTASELAKEYTCVACGSATAVNAKKGTCDTGYICNQDEGVYFDTCVGTTQTTACASDTNCHTKTSVPGGAPIVFCDLVTTSPSYQFCVQCDAASSTCASGSCDLTPTDQSYNLCASCSPTNDTTNASCTTNDARKPVCDTTAACKQCPTVSGSETQSDADAFCPGHATTTSLHCTSNVCACNVDADCPGGGSSPASCNTVTGFCNL